MMCSIVNIMSLEIKKEALSKINAFRNVSFSPEKRIERFVKDYESDYNRIIELCSQYNVENVKFIEKHYRLALDYLHAQSRVASWAITGAGNFPVRSMEKKLNSCHNKMGLYVNYIEYVEKILKRINRRLETQDDKKAKWIKEIAERKALQEQMKDVNSLLRKGKKEEAEKKYNIIITPNCWGGLGYESYQLRNNLANIKRLEEQVRIIDVARDRLQGFEFEGGKVEFDEEEIRYNIYFDDIPSQEIRDNIKRRGFKWSPRRKAWTRGAKTISQATIKSLLGV